MLVELVDEYEPLFGAIQYSLSTPLPVSLALTVNDVFVYFPVVEVDAPLIVGLVLSTYVSTTKLNEYSVEYVAYALGFGFQPCPYSLPLNVYLPSDNPVSFNVVVEVFPTSCPLLFVTVMECH